MEELPERRVVKHLSPDSIAVVNQAIQELQQHTALDTQKGLLLIYRISHGVPLGLLPEQAPMEMQFLRGKGLVQQHQPVANGAHILAMKEAVELSGYQDHCTAFTLVREEDKLLPARVQQKKEPAPKKIMSWVNGEKLDWAAAQRVNAGIRKLGAMEPQKLDFQKALDYLHQTMQGAPPPAHEHIEEIKALRGAGLLDGMGKMIPELSDALKVAVKRVEQPDESALIQGGDATEKERAMFRARHPEGAGQAPDPAPDYVTVPLQRDFGKRPAEAAATRPRFSIPKPGEGAQEKWESIIARADKRGRKDAVDAVARVVNVARECIQQDAPEHEQQALAILYAGLHKQTLPQGDYRGAIRLLQETRLVYDWVKSVQDNSADQIKLDGNFILSKYRDALKEAVTRDKDGVYSMKKLKEPKLEELSHAGRQQGKGNGTGRAV